MALGGGTFLTQNKVIPGAYINFVSASKASKALSERGVVAMPIELNWGVDREVFTVDNSEFQKKSLQIFGYDVSSNEMKGLRELFAHAKKVHFYRLNSGEKAKNDLVTARYSGVTGNQIKIVVTNNTDDEEAFEVTTYMGTIKVDTQIVKSAMELTTNDFVEFNESATLVQTVGMPLSGGTNGEVTGSNYQDALDKLESYSFNVLAVVTTDSLINGLVKAYTKRLRDEVGVKFQTVMYQYAADYEGIISVKNTVKDMQMSEASLVYWVAGVCAECAINKSNTNKQYDGELEVETSFTQSELKKSIEEGEFVLHKVDNLIKVLEDINSLISVSVEMNQDFKSNQTIRILDQMGNDLAVLFNESYLGKVKNNEAGRISYWKDIVKYDKELEKLEAIENFNPDEVVVEAGEDKKSIVVTNPVQVVNCMSKLYMTIVVA